MNLEETITKAFYDNVPNCCEKCEYEMFYPKYGDPIGAIMDALQKDWVLLPKNGDKVDKETLYNAHRIIYNEYLRLGGEVGR